MRPALNRRISSNSDVSKAPRRQFAPPPQRVYHPFRPSAFTVTYRAKLYRSRLHLMTCRHKARAL